MKGVEPIELGGATGWGLEMPYAKMIKTPNFNSGGRSVRFRKTLLRFCVQVPEYKRMARSLTATV